MRQNAINIHPEWTETEIPGLQEPSLRQAIANAFYAFGNRQGYLFLPKIEGMLSTTFSHPVFAMPHLDASFGVHGFHTAFRPTDMDEGTHLVAFGQYYICTNAPLPDQFSLIRETILDIIHSTFPSDLGLTDLGIEEGCYEWRADSTGYKGGGGEVNVTSVTINGHEHKIGRLELAQINDYAVSGNVQGKPCHLIVFGIDRLINLFALAKALKEGGSALAAHLSFEDLYLMGEKEAADHKGLIDVFRSMPSDEGDLLSSIHSDFYDLDQDLAKNEFNGEVFSRLGRLSSLAEGAYASNAVTRNYRQYLIRKLGRLYALFAKDIASNPEKHLRIIRNAAASGMVAAVEEPSVYDVIEQPFFKRHFKLVPRKTERAVHEHLIPENLVRFFEDEEIIGGIKLRPSRLEELKEVSKSSSPEPLEAMIQAEQQRLFHMMKEAPEGFPQFQIKREMFRRVVGEDLALPIETLAHPTQQVLTLAGSVAARIDRIRALLDFLDSEGMLQDASPDYETLRCDLRYLAVEWQYHSVKIYPQLEGSLGVIAMRQQGYKEALIRRVEAYHQTGAKQHNYVRDPETAALMLVGKLDEAVSLFARSIEDGRSIGSMDPFGVKTKIAASVEAAIALGLSLTNMRELLVQITKINPDAIGDETTILDGYFWARVEKAFFDKDGQTHSKKRDQHTPQNKRIVKVAKLCASQYGCGMLQNETLTFNFSNMVPDAPNHAPTASHRCRHA